MVAAANKARDTCLVILSAASRMKPYIHTQTDWTRRTPFGVVSVISKGNWTYVCANSRKQVNKSVRKHVLCEQAVFTHRLHSSILLWDRLMGS